MNDEEIVSFLCSPVFSPDQGFLGNDLPFGQFCLLQPHNQAEVQTVWSPLSGAIRSEHEHEDICQ